MLVRGKARESDRLTHSRSRLVEEHLDLVRVHLARHVRLNGRATCDREAEDLFQEGCIGLVRAAMSYSPKQHGPFAPYALARIRAAVHRALHEAFATVRVPVTVLDRRKAAARCNRKRGTRPTAAPLPRRRRKDLARIIAEHDTPGAPVADGDTVGRHAWAKYCAAARVAADRVARRCRRTGARRAMRAIVTERLTVPCPEQRASLRAVGRRFGVSSGRATEWERRIHREAVAMLVGDEEVRTLHRMASATVEGPDRIVDAPLEAELAKARSAILRDKLARLGGAARSSLIERVFRAAGRETVGETAAVFDGLPCDTQREILAAVAR